MIGYATLSFLTIITLQWLYELVRLWHIPSSLSLPLVSFAGVLVRSASFIIFMPFVRYLIVKFLIYFDLLC